MEEPARSADAGPNSDYNNAVIVPSITTTNVDQTNQTEKLDIYVRPKR